MAQLKRRGAGNDEELGEGNECGYETDCEKKSFGAKFHSQPDKAIDRWFTKNYQTLIVCHIVVALFLWACWMNRDELEHDLEKLPFLHKHDYSVLSNVTNAGLGDIDTSEVFP